MKQKFILLLISITVIFMLTELSLYIFVDSDLDGNMSLNYVHLKPYKLPILETEKKIAALLKHKVPDSLLQQYEQKDFKRNYFDVRLIPDSILGWKPSPYYKSKNELYIYNKDGIRCNDILKKYPKKKKLRIALFGDSYIHGDEVKFNNTIGNYLELLLNKSGIETEVMNFGVSGFGIDQAFLRWQTIKDKFKPDIVILGIQFENAKRNINLLRPFYYFTTDIPYSKPRFVIQNNQLHLIKNPIPDITKIVAIIEHFKDWEFSKFEGFFSDKKYNPNFFYYSKTISFISSALEQIFGEINFYTPKSESYQVTYKLFNKFKSSVEKNNEIFIPIHLPVKDDFDFMTKQFVDKMYNQKFIYDELYNTLKLSSLFVEPYGQLEKWGNNNGTDKLFMSRHYSPTANKIIAKEIFRFLEREHPQLFKTRMSK